MNVQRGDVVLVDYPYAAGGGTKVARPCASERPRQSTSVRRHKTKGIQSDLCRNAIPVES